MHFPVKITTLVATGLAIGLGAALLSGATEGTAAEQSYEFIAVLPSDLGSPRILRQQVRPGQPFSQSNVLDVPEEDRLSGGEYVVTGGWAGDQTAVIEFVYSEIYNYRDGPDGSMIPQRRIRQRVYRVTPTRERLDLTPRAGGEPRSYLVPGTL